MVCLATAQASQHPLLITGISGSPQTEQEKGEREDYLVLELHSQVPVPGLVSRTFHEPH